MGIDALRVAGLGAKAHRPSGPYQEAISTCASRAMPDLTPGEFQRVLYAVPAVPVVSSPLWSRGGRRRAALGYQAASARVVARPARLLVGSGGVSSAGLLVGECLELGPGASACEGSSPGGSSIPKSKSSSAGSGGAPMTGGSASVWRRRRRGRAGRWRAEDGAGGSAGVVCAGLASAGASGVVGSGCTPGSVVVGAASAFSWEGGRGSWLGVALIATGSGSEDMTCEVTPGGAAACDAMPCDASPGDEPIDAPPGDAAPGDAAPGPPAATAGGVGLPA